MSYSIVFETKILKLPDGKIIHFSRNGCNNDDCGRKKDEFTANVYNSEQEFIKFAEKFKDENPEQEYCLKIGSKWATLNDYYNHLVRMLKRGKSLEQFNEEFIFRGNYCDTVEVYSPERVTLSSEEFSKKIYKYLYGGKPFSYKPNNIMLDISYIDKIINRLTNNKPITFEINRRKRN